MLKAIFLFNSINLERKKAERCEKFRHYYRFKNNNIIN